jgi:hypothetical protein
MQSIDEILRNIGNSLAGHGYADGSTWERQPRAPEADLVQVGPGSAAPRDAMPLAPLGGLTHPAAYQARMPRYMPSQPAPRPTPSLSDLAPLGATMPGAIPPMRSDIFQSLPATAIGGSSPVIPSGFQRAENVPENIGGARDPAAARRAIAGWFYKTRGAHPWELLGGSNVVDVPTEEALALVGEPGYEKYLP